MIIVDTGYWFGLLDQRDDYHAVCCEFLSQCQEPLITTFPVLTEALHLLMRRGNSQQGLVLLELLSKLQTQGSFSIFSLQHEHLPRITQLMQQYIDLPMDLADASLVILAEHLGEGRIISTDQRDFHTYRWKNHHPFTNLLTPY
ncbi:type II toxin-antitoxin system VapC family toxin [Candidatus Venteria ishoeyi]|uniref:tRNA(fMet)-specific endonuclease VapC n=1 Tax=Candidatus Venteria ishoeyi TaxID=1899563 RepID=A0A1H6F4N0_9GAMM|nr:PIN domain-containing protein [Candidatus Venteria ishoeyi]SEH05052.1 tRNA(fMet)-specific endonuclease VapC [Candidatus Venteria ishoeyi]